MNFFSTPYTSVQQVLQPPFSRSTCPYRVASFFQRTSQPKGQDQQNSIRKYSRLPPKCLRINLKNMLSYFYRSIRAGFISPDIFLNFYSKRYISPWFKNILNFLVFRSTHIFFQDWGQVILLILNLGLLLNNRCSLANWKLKTKFKLIKRRSLQKSHAYLICIPGRSSHHRRQQQEVFCWIASPYVVAYVPLRARGVCCKTLEPPMGFLPHPEWKRHFEIVNIPPSSWMKETFWNSCWQ